MLHQKPMSKMSYRQPPLSVRAVAVWLLAASSPLAAQTPPTPTPVADPPPAQLEPLVVKGQALQRETQAYSASRLDQDTIRARGVNSVEQMFREVPGMNVQDFQLGGVASSTVIRGFGAGAHGGDMGLVVDGIPLNEANSHADGYVDSSVLIPLEVRDLTVYRGPVSALYGNFNRGGLVSIDTRKSGRYAEADLLGATTDATFDAQGALGRPLGRSGQLNAAAQIFRTDGFRAQSQAERMVAAGRYGWAAGDRLQLSVAGRAFAGEADSAAYLTPAQFAVDPYGIDPRTQNDGSDKQFSTLRADAGYALSAQAQWLTFAYTTQQDFTRWFSRGAPDPAANWRQREEAYDRSVYGLESSLNGRLQWGPRALDYVLGVEGFNEATAFQFYDDLNQRQRTTPAQNDRESTLRSLSVYGEAGIPLSARWHASVGGRYDSFTGDCRLRGPETGTDPCQDLQRVGHFSPKLGLRFQVAPSLQLRGSLAEGFALANGFAKFAPEAQALEPNQIRQLELGLALTPGDGVELDLALYQIESSQEIGSPAPGEFENFGRTEREGLELTLGWQPHALVQLQLIATQTDSRVAANRNTALIGNTVSGVPENLLTFIATWQPRPALELTGLYRHVGSYFVNASNALEAPSYAVTDLHLTYAFPRADRLRARLLIDNLFDAVYATTVNTIGFAPGAPRTIRLGLQFDL